MGWIIFNGINSLDLGVVIEKMPENNRGMRRVDEYEIIGRDGALTVDEGAYNNYTTDLTVNCFGVSDPNILYSWLNGAGWLTTSDNPDKRRWVNFFSAADDERWRTNRIYDSISFHLVCAPFQYEKGDPHFEAGIDTETLFRGRGDVKAFPLFKVEIPYGESEIRCNDTTIVFTTPQGGIVYLDNDAKVAYCEKDGQRTMAKANGIDVTISSTDETNRWAKLVPGQNRIWTDCIVKLTVNPRWRWF